MPYGYTGQNTPNQLVRNTGFFSINDAYNLTQQGYLGGSYELIASQTLGATAFSEVTFRNLPTETYDVFKIVSKMDAGDGTNGGGIGLQFYENDVLESANVYNRTIYIVYDTGSTFDNRSTAQANPAVLAQSTSTGKGSSATCYVYNAGNPNSYTYTSWQVGSEINNGQWRGHKGSGNLPQASKVDGFRCYSNASDIGNCTIAIYGMKDIT